MAEPNEVLRAVRTEVGKAVKGQEPVVFGILAALLVRGHIILEGVPVEEVGRQIFEEILAVASGKKTKSEINGVGEEEFAPWSIGPTL